MAAAVIGIIAVLATACTLPPPEKTSQIHVGMVDDGFDVTWPATSGGAANGYDVQMRSSGGEWQAYATTAVPSLEFRGAVPRTSYQFRVRDRVPPGSPLATFESSVAAVYVEPELPVVRINTDGYAPILDKVNYRDGDMTIDPNGSEFAAYSGSMRIRGRGNSTWTSPKKPYRIKLDTKSPIMGMPAHKDWVLLANYMDKSQMRTWTAAQISESTDLAWTPHYQFVEVILNGTYLGVYQLAENIEVGKDRVNITEMEDTDNAGEAVTGGYLMELDDRLEENNEPGWRTSHNVPVVVKEPDPMTPQQRSYIRNFVTDFESKLYSSQFTDPVSGYAPFVDVPAAIDYWIVQELTRNGDSYWSSTFFTKDRSSNKLVMGPIWDFDRSIDSQVTPRPQPPEGWYARGNGRWNARMFQDPNYVDQVQARWAELAPTLLTIPEEIVTVGHTLRGAISNDEARWNYNLAPTDQPEHLADWLTTRINWISEAFIAEG